MKASERFEYPDLDSGRTGDRRFEALVAEEGRKVRTPAGSVPEKFRSG